VSGAQSEKPNRALSPLLMNRRDALIRVSALMGGTLVGGSALLSGCAVSGSRPPGEVFSPVELELLDAIADTILPQTGTPGAREAGVGSFMSVMVADTYTQAEQGIFLNGLDRLNVECVSDHGVGFADATSVQRTALLQRLDREQYDYMRARAPGSPIHYFRMLKELTLSGYFTSEIGYTQAMRYIESPGRFDPCVPYRAGDRAWAPHA
jgi:hypothetical protein